MFTWGTDLKVTAADGLPVVAHTFTTACTGHHPLSEPCPEPGDEGN